MVDNQTFLAGVFQGLQENEVCWTCNFPDSPDAPGASNVRWKGRKTYLDVVDHTPYANSYFSVASFQRYAKGRTKHNFSRLFAVVLDDPDKVPLTPTWLLQTSENSYQAGYRLAAPIADQHQASSLVEALQRAGLVNADKSGNAIVRYVRLPVGHNNKIAYGQPFQCRLIEWQPDRSYTVEALCDGLGLSLDTNPTALDALPKRIPESEYLALQDLIRAGQSYHTPLVRIAAKRISNGLSEIATIDELQALMNGSTGERDERWQSRYDDIARIVRTCRKLKPNPSDKAAMEALFEALEKDAPSTGWHVMPYGVQGLPDLSHDQLALELSKAGFNADARYVPQWGKWYFWTGSRWQRDDKLMHLTATRDYLRAKATKLLDWADKRADAIIAAGENDAETEVKKIKAFARDNARMLRQHAYLTALESVTRSNSDLVAVPEQFDADPMLLGTPSGTVDLMTGEIRAANRKDYISRQCAVTAAPKGTPCPSWERFLYRVMGDDQEMVEFLQRVVGYALTGHTSEHKLFFLFGTGRNGKSVFVNTVYALMGEYAKRAPAQTFLDSHGERHPTDLAGLQGARLVAGSELPAGKSWNESIIKDLTGGDIITARFMRGDFFEYSPQFTLFIAGNHQPAIKTTDEAMRARIVLIPFTVTIPEHERDPKLEQKLKQEWPAILRWAIDGAVAWATHGLMVPESVKAASRDYLDMEDYVGEFIAERLINIPGSITYTDQLYRAFSEWQRESGISPWTKKAMAQALTERGLVSQKLTGGKRGYKGLSLVPSEAPEHYMIASGR